jgi:autotransporter-associated beta strand protein
MKPIRNLARLNRSLFTASISNTRTLGILGCSIAVFAGPVHASIWNYTVSGGNWSDDSSIGWNSTGVPNSSTAIADFSTLDITVANTVHLDGSFQVNKLLFGDTTASNNWSLDNNSDPFNVLTLSGVNPTIQVNNQTADISAQISGSAGLTKAGTGTLVLSSTTNDYVGTTSVKSGKIQLTGSLSSASSLSLANGTFEYNKASGTQNLTNLTLTGGYNVLTGTAGTLTFTGSVTRNTGAMLWVPIANVKFTGVATNTFMPGMFNGAAAANTTFVVIDSATNMARAKNYTTDDAGANFQTSNTTFSEIGATNAGKHIQLGSGTTAGGLAVTAQPSISIKSLYNAYHSTAITILSDNVMTITDGFILNGRDQTLPINGGSISNNDSELFIRSSRTAKDIGIGSNITGTGGLTVSGAGATGVGVQLNGVNDFTGDTRSVQGASGLSLNHSLALKNSTLDMNAADSGPVNFKQATHTLGGLKGSRNLTMPTTSLTVGGNGQSTSYSGVLSRAGASLIKTGTGTLTLTATNTYSGATIISGGTLLINGALSGTGDVSVAMDATIGGSGGTIAGAVSVDAGGFVAPGNSIGTLGVASAVINGTLAVQYDGVDTGTIDLLNVTGGLNIDSATVDFSQLGSAADDASYIFATYGSLIGTTNTFFNVLNKPTGYDIDYSYGGNNIALVLVPETGTMMLGALGALSLLRRRRA